VKPAPVYRNEKKWKRSCRPYENTTVSRVFEEHYKRLDPRNLKKIKKIHDQHCKLKLFTMQLEVLPIDFYCRFTNTQNGRSLKLYRGPDALSRLGCQMRRSYSECPSRLKSDFLLLFLSSRSSGSNAESRTYPSASSGDTAKSIYAHECRMAASVSSEFAFSNKTRFSNVLCHH
jgi:hypothetical protein